MAAVKLETRNEGRGLREWDYVPLSEPRVVARQIKNRRKADETYIACMNPSYNPTATNGVFPFSEPVLTTYMDLDRLIAKAGLTPSENKVVGWLMQGYIEADIADHCGIARQAVDTLLARAVARIVRANNDEWREAYAVV